MDWIVNLFTQPGVGPSIMFLALTITAGILFGRIKIAGISLGITWILFVGIFLGHIGVVIEPNMLHFAKEFGLILFVYAIGLQVGPGFFASFKQGGLRLNLMAVTIVLLGMVTTYVIHLLSHEDLSTMSGVYTGAITNTPGLGAAQQTYTDLHGTANPDIALGYAAAYPLGVVGLILSCLLIKWICGVRLDRENTNAEVGDVADRFFVRITRSDIDGQTLGKVASSVEKPFVVSRIKSIDGKVDVAHSGTILHQGDVLLAVVYHNDIETIVPLFGERCEEDGSMLAETSQVVSRRIAVTNKKLNGTHLGGLHVNSLYNVNITRVNRSGIELVATDNLGLQMGDRVSVVGHQSDIDRVAELLGNSMKRLDQPNLIPIFLGIFLGIVLGMVPIKFPGLPMPVKLGLAGGPLIVAILIGRFGPFYRMVTYTTTSANLMLREVGISLFLAAVGLGAGEHFVDTIVGGGYIWVAYGIIITMLPIMLVALVGRLVFKMNYFTLMGLIAGSTTAPPTLAYANSLSDNNLASVAYATVYPLTMFLRILTAQILVLMA